MSKRDAPSDEEQLPMATSQTHESLSAHPQSLLPFMSDPVLDAADRELADLHADAMLEDDEDDDDAGEDLFASDMERDYQANDVKDRYDTRGIDDEEEWDDMDATTRKLVDLKLKRRDREEARRQGRLPAAFISSDEAFAAAPLPMQQRRRRKDDQLFDMIAEDDGAAAMAADLADDELHNVKGRLSDWVRNAGPRALIKRKFKHFLTTVKDADGHSVYGPKINRIGNEESLIVSFVDLETHSAILSYYVSACPIEVLPIFDEVALDVVLDWFENYGNIQKQVHVRISDIPVTETLRDLRQSNLNTLVKVSGVVTKRTGVFPQLKYVKYECIKCGAMLGPFYQEPGKPISIGHCHSCSSKGPFEIDSEQTVYQNFQKITLQEAPGTVPAGRLPRHREVILLWDLVDSARPGEEIEVTGIYRNNLDITLNSKSGFPVFATVIEANYIFKKEDLFQAVRLNEDDVAKIRELASQKDIVNRIVNSVAPSIYGHTEIKRALALSMFGGVPKNPQGKHRIRGDINVLMLGDPGTAKSQFLKYVEKTAHRAVYSTGQGASAVGLTAAVHKDPITREWTLEGGALVMADKGVCMIDEFDKMNDQDRTSIHEAMEQQSISISKAGIITSLQARCAIIAAANPIRGRYNPQIPFSANVELTEPILSRFDILCVVRDVANHIVDEHLARFVCNSHIKSHPDFDSVLDQGMVNEGASSLIGQSQLDADKIIPQDLLKKYIMFARSSCNPRITNTDEDKLAKFYGELRRESLSSGAIPITVRYLESMIRMAEAFARMSLRDNVLQSDIDRAISVMVYSFVSTQKIGAQRALEKYLKKYMTFGEDSFELLNHVLCDLMNEEYKYFYYKKKPVPGGVLSVDMDQFEIKAGEFGVDDVSSFYQSPLFRDSFQVDLQGKKITKSLVATEAAVEEDADAVDEDEEL